MPFRHVRHHSRTVLVAALLSLLALSTTTGAASASGGSASEKSSYKIGSSCKAHGPYKHSTKCRYPAGGRFTTSFFFKSKGGGKKVKVCNQISGPAPLGSHHSCVTLPGKTSRKVYPFNGAGLHGTIHIKLDWYVKHGGKYKKVGTARQTLVPN